MGMHGECHIELVRGGVVIAEETTHNITVNAGIAQSVLLCFGQGGTAFGYIGVGIGTVAPAATDTALTSEVQRTLASITITTTSVTNDTAQLTGGFLFSSTYSVTECGVFNSVGVGTGVMLGHVLFGTTYAVLVGDQLNVTWNEIVNGS